MTSNSTEIELTREALREERVTVCEAGRILERDVIALEDSAMLGGPVFLRVKRRYEDQGRRDGIPESCIYMDVMRVAAGLGRLAREDVERLVWLRRRIETLEARRVAS